jgi:hypothetical protein
MHQRLQQLEHLVMSMAPHRHAPPSLPSSSISPRAAPPLGHALASSATDRGIMRASDSQSQYLGSDHWAAIMDSIAELKDHFQLQEQIRLSQSPEQAQGSVGTASSGQAHQSTHSLLLYGQGGHISHTELISALPSRATIDRYISRYFNRQEMISCK